MDCGPISKRKRLSSWLLCSVMTLLTTSAAQQLDSSGPVYSAPHAPLSIEEVTSRLEEKNSERAAGLAQFDGTRIYRMQYRGFFSDRDAEMVVHVAFRAPDSKQFTIVSQTGSKFVIDHVFKRLLESEQEAFNEENRRQTALSTENYTFTFAGFDSRAGPAGEYILNLMPKNKNKYLYVGRIWVDANDFAVTRIVAEPAKNPSLWIKKTAVEHTYTKVEGFWLPSENHTESVMRLGGQANLSIEYKDYRITKAAPPRAFQAARKSPAR